MSAQVSGGNTHSRQCPLSAQALGRTIDEQVSSPSALVFKSANMSQLVNSKSTDLKRLEIKQQLKGELTENVKISGLLIKLTFN